MPVFRERMFRDRRYVVVLRREGEPDDQVDVTLRGSQDSDPTVWSLACLAFDIEPEPSDAHFHATDWMINGPGEGAAGVMSDEVMGSQRVKPGQVLTIRFERCTGTPKAESVWTGSPEGARGNN